MSSATKHPPTKTSRRSRYLTVSAKVSQGTPQMHARSSILGPSVSDRHRALFFCDRECTNSAVGRTRFSTRMRRAASYAVRLNARRQLSSREHELERRGRHGIYGPLTTVRPRLVTGRGGPPHRTWDGRRHVKVPGWRWRRSQSLVTFARALPCSSAPLFSSLTDLSLSLLSLSEVATSGKKKSTVKV